VICKGCGADLPAANGRGRARLWCSEACRNKHRRRGPKVAANRARAGLEAWLEDQRDVPSVLVESARVLADEVDARPGDSPLWGRYLDCLRQLTGPEQQAIAWNDEVRQIYEEFASIQVAEEWRAEKCRQALADGKDASRWGHLCPVGCVMGRHDWHRWGGPESPAYCLDCLGRLEQDGTMFWDDWVAPKAWDEP
jgi:hypothetical protein